MYEYTVTQHNILYIQFDTPTHNLLESKFTERAADNTGRVANKLHVC